MLRAAGRPRRRRLCLALLCLLVAPLASADPRASADPVWRLAERNDDPVRGFSLYQRKVDASSYRRYRLETVFAASIERLIAALQIKMRDDRYLGKGQRRTILQEHGGESLQHLQLRVPLFSDRDVVLRVIRGFDTRGVYRVVWRTANDEGPPRSDGIVRIERSEGFWEFTPLDAGTTKAVHETFVDPGGAVPAWLVNTRLDDQAIEELELLQTVLEKELPVTLGPTDEAS